MRGKKAVDRARVRRRPTLVVLTSLGSLFLLNAAAAQQTPPPGPTVTVIATPASPVASPAPSLSPTSTPVAGYVAANAELDDIVWARDIDPNTNKPTRVATGFITTDATIYATMAVRRIDAGVTVTAEWSFNGEALPSLTATVTLDQGYQNGWIEFHLTKPDAEIWPIGTYGIAIKIDGVEALTSEIVVSVPPG